MSIIIIIKEPLSVGVLRQVVADKAGVEKGGSSGPQTDCIRKE